MSSEEVSQALQNLGQIREGNDPRQNTDSSEYVNAEQAINSESERAIADMKHEVLVTLQEYPELQEHISLGQLSFYVAEWKRRRGLCSYNKYVERDSFGERVDRSEFERKSGYHAIGLARRVYEDESNWKGTVRHELAHAVLYEKHGKSQKHNENFEKLNEKICGSRHEHHQREDWNYAISCPNGCFTLGRMRRSKKIQRPWDAVCTHCGVLCVSHDYDEEPPSTGGICAVESIDWRTEREYESGSGEL